LSASSQSLSSTADLEILEEFHRLTLDLAGERNPEAVLRNALQSALTLCGGDAGAVYLLRGETNILERQCSVGGTVTTAGERLTVGEGVTGVAVKQARALLVNDYLSWSGRSPQYPGRQRSAMAAPLSRRGAVIGAIMVVTENRTDVYTDADLRLLERFAAFSSVILESARLHESLDLERRRAQERASRRERVQAVIARAMSESEPLVALRELIEGCGEALRCQGGACLVVPGRDDLEWLSEPLHVPGAPVRLGEGLIGGIAESGETVLVNDYPQWEGRLETYAQAGVKSVIAAPLKRGAEVVGVVFLEHHTQTHYFMEDDLELLSQVAVVASGMLEHARLYTEAAGARAVAERRNALLEATHEFNLELGRQHELSELLNLLLQRATALLGGDAGGVYLIEGDEIRLVTEFGDELVPRAPLGYGVSGTVASRGEPMLVEDYVTSPYYDDDQPGVPWRAVMSVPLRRASNVIGALTVVDTRFAGRFGEEDLEALERFASLGSLALENTTLLETTRQARDGAERQRSLLEALSEVSLELVARLEPAQMLQRLTERTSVLFEADASAVYLSDADRDRYERVAWHGQSPSPSGTFGRGLSGRVMALGEPIRIGDYQTWEGRDIALGEVSRWRGAMSAPLRRGDTVIGALTVARTESSATFTTADLETLERFATFASLALEKAQLLEDTRRAEREASTRLEQLEALDAVSLQLLEQREPSEVVQRTLRLLMPLVGATTSGYWRYHPEAQDLELTLVENFPAGLLGIRQGLHDGLSGSVIETGAALLVDDYQTSPQRNPNIPVGYRSVMLAPLTSDAQVIGVLVLSHEHPAAFTPADLETVKRFAALASVALENARLLEGMRQAEARASDRNALLETLHSVNLELGNYVRLQPLLLSILERATRMLGGHDGRLYLRQPGQDAIRLAAYIGGIPIEEVQLGQGASGMVALTGEALVIEDYLQWEHNVGLGQRWRSVISVPLKRGTELLGALTVVDVQTPARFNALDLEALERFAAFASLALQKAQLLEDARNAERDAAERAEQLEALHQVSLELGGQLEPERLLSSILERAAQLLGGNAGGVFLNDPSGTETVMAAVLGPRLAGRVALGAGVSGRVALDGEPQLIDDYQAWSGRVDLPGSTWRSVASVPLRRGSSIVGALTVADNRESGRFKPRDLEVLGRFAALASVALENSRLYLRERQNLSDERVRARITQEITRLRRVPDAAKALLMALNETLGYRHLTLYLRDGDRLRLQAQLGSASPHAEIPIARGVTGRVVRTAKAQLVPDVRLEPDFLFDAPDLTSLVSIPLLGRDGVIGTLNVEGTLEQPMQTHDLEMLQALSPAFSTALENASLHERLERKAQELNFLRFQAERAARYDPLTDLRNRRAFEEDLSKSFERFNRSGHAFSLGVVDLAGFKAVNDSLGHAAGDEALRRIAKVLAGHGTQATHRAYRSGGDEFLLLMPSPKEVPTLLRNIIRDVQSLEFEGGLHITPNIGVATFPTDADDLDRLQTMADKRMYAAKAAGQSILEGDDLEHPPSPKRRVGD
jgi:diguanylate cyclase (GGDEF)-like protein